MIRYIYNINNPRIKGLKHCSLNRHSELHILQKAIAKKLDIPIHKITSKKRSRKLVEARVEFTRQARKIIDDPEIIMNHINRDRTTFYHYINYPYI